MQNTGLTGSAQLDQQASKVSQVVHVTEPRKNPEANRVTQHGDAVMSKEEKLKQKKIRLKKARARFQESMDRLHEELDLVKSDDSFGVLAADNFNVLDNIEEDAGQDIEEDKDNETTAGVFWDALEDFYADSSIEGAFGEIREDVDDCEEYQALMSA
ncbi:hypothetical protein ACMFMG_012133 [Clarireedia jacksonii]